MEFANHGGEGVRTGRGSQEVVRGLKGRCPVAQGLVNGVLEGPTARGYGNDSCPHEFHALDVWGLPNNIDRAHVDRAFQSQKRAHHCGCGPVLAGSGFSDDARLTHALSQQSLSQNLITLVCASVDQIFTLEEDPSTATWKVAKLCDGGGASQELMEQSVDLLDEGWVVNCLDEGFFKLVQCGDQKLGNVLSAELTEVVGCSGVSSSFVPSAFAPRRSLE